MSIFRRNPFCSLAIALEIVLISFSAGAFAKQVRSAAPRFQCGTYRVHGILEMRPGSVDIIVLYPKTTAQTEIPVSRVTPSDKAGFAGQRVEAEIEVIEASSKATRARVLKPLRGASRDSIEKMPYELLKAKPCP